MILLFVAAPSFSRINDAIVRGIETKPRLHLMLKIELAAPVYLVDSLLCSYV